MERNEALFAQRLNFLVNSNDEVEKSLGHLLASLINIESSQRPQISEIRKQIEAIEDSLQKQIVET